MKMHWAFISVGSNLGDPIQNCRQGIRALCRDEQVRLVASSTYYATEPVDYLDQDWFINAAIKIETELAPLDLLVRMQAVQEASGRKADSIRFGPRVLDLDIIFYEDLVLKTAQLTIPHPRMHKRRFVLQPICDIDPSVVHPVLGENVQTLLNRLVKNGQQIRPCFDSACR